MTHDSTKRRGAFPVAIALLSAALFGAATPASKYLLRDLSPFTLAGLLYLGAAVAVAPRALRGGAPKWRLDRKNALRLGGAVLFGGGLGPVLLLVGLGLASAASVSMWLNLEMVATAVLGTLVFRDHLGGRGWAGVAGVVVASAMLTYEEGTAGPRAGLFVAAACVCWGLDNHLTALIDGITPTQSTLAKGLAAGAVNLAIGLSLQPVGATATALTFLLAGVVGALSYGASIALYITAAQQMGATRAQMVFASAPFFGVALAAAALKEPLSAIQLTSAAVLVASLMLLFRDRHTHEHVHEPMEHAHMHRHDDGHHTHVHEGLPASTRHSHWHRHERVVHSHPHWPDLHHRHDHD